MPQSTIRPFYHRFAWAYDLLIDAPISDRCRFIEQVLQSSGIPSSGLILDAGCGTGAYTIELARRGYETIGIDISCELIEIARRKVVNANLPVSFLEKQILDLDDESLPLFDAVLCRGVLNDFVDDAERLAVFRSLGAALVDGGKLILDVRDWEATCRKISSKPVFEKCVDSCRGQLTFRSFAKLDYSRKMLLLKENHTLAGFGETLTAEHDFAMRCWTEGELRSGLTDAAFGDIVCYGDYDTSVPLGATDRIVVVASLIKSSG